MLRLVLSAVFWVAGALAQDNHATDGFTYIGCLQISSPADYEVPLDAANSTPEACQQACAGFSYAAVYRTVCKCSDVVDKTHVAETICDNWCDGDPSLGKCGSCTDDGYSNVYECVSAVESQAPAKVSATITVSPYSPPEVQTPATAPAPEPATSTSCVEIVNTPSPVEPAPEPSSIPGYGTKPAETVAIQETTWTSVAVQTSFTTPVVYSTTPRPSSTSPSPSPVATAPAPAPEVPEGYGDQGGQAPADAQPTPTRSPTLTIVVSQSTAPAYGNPAATPNSGFTSTKEASAHSHTSTKTNSSATGTGTPAAAGAGNVGPHLLAVLLALGIAAA